jgi:hypothetical protein
MTEVAIILAALGCPAAMGAIMWLLLRSWRGSGKDRDPDAPDQGEWEQDH